MSDVLYIPYEEHIAALSDMRNKTLEEAAKVCDEYEDITVTEKDSALLLGMVDLSNAMSGEPRAARFLSEAIRSLKEPT
ncbi:MAG: hypothetical protein NVS3B3_18660 [Aquirhabdus sp.]